MRISLEVLEAYCKKHLYNYMAIGIQKSIGDAQTPTQGLWKGPLCKQVFFLLPFPSAWTKKNFVQDKIKIVCYSIHLHGQSHFCLDQNQNYHRKNILVQV